MVDEQLARLPDSWRVIPDIPLNEKDHNLDHLSSAREASSP